MSVNAEFDRDIIPAPFGQAPVGRLVERHRAVSAAVEIRQAFWEFEQA